MKVPILQTTPPPEFGELKDTPAFHEPGGMDRDFTYVPGFSDLRRQRDLAIAEVVRGRRRASEVPTLPLNFYWARCQNRKGDPDNRKVISRQNKGYRAVTKDDIGEGKLLPNMPAGSVAMVDGTIRQGDTQLMVATAEKAAKNEFYKRVRTESMTRGAIEGFEAACRAAGLRSVKGAAPVIEQESGTKTVAELSPKPKEKK